ncbi:virion structural protein [Variola virus]|uniref:Assembly protein G7 n=1 Tax=Variola virus TaxID=10255 RepID=Q0NG68_VARV|nr:virion structural protein [Variola virus]ABF25445.1 virion structural protein [Variola virus]
MAAEQRRSTIFDIVSKCIVQSVLRDISINSEYIESKAKQLCYCPASKKESVINGIYNCCESNIEIMDKEQLLKILDNLRCHSAHVCNATDFWRLYNSLKRFTHTTAFFNTCKPTILATLNTLITLILSNKLLYAAEMVEYLENQLDSSNKSMSQELAELLEMKYALINLVQYRILPMIIGEPIIVAGFSGKEPISNYSAEVERLMELPVKTDIVNTTYDFLARKGIDTSNNIAEYIAGLKIEEIEKVEKYLPEVISTIANSNIIKNKKSIFPANINDKQIMECSKMLDTSEKYSKGYKTNGAVTSPLTGNNTITTFIPISASDMQKFTILEYLYIMRVMANNVKKKNEGKNNGGVVMHINSPFKVINLPKC